MVKVGNWYNPFSATNPPGNNWVSNVVAALDWLAGNSLRGTIVNMSLVISNSNFNCQNAYYDIAFENAVKAAYNNGLIVVVAAGNDGCNTANFSPTRIPEAFVVGATGKAGFDKNAPKDARAIWPKPNNYPAGAKLESRIGANISAFAPGDQVRFMDANGGISNGGVGTSTATPHIAGIFAIACEASAPFCDTTNPSTNAGPIYSALRAAADNTYNNTVPVNTVAEIDGISNLPNNTPPRFIRQQW